MPWPRPPFFDFFYNRERLILQSILHTSGFIKMVPSVYTLSINTIYLQSMSIQEVEGTLFRKHMLAQLKKFGEGGFNKTLFKQLWRFDSFGKWRITTKLQKRKLFCTSAFLNMYYNVSDQNMRSLIWKYNILPI